MATSNQLAKQVKDHFKKSAPAVRVRSINGRRNGEPITHYIEAWNLETKRADRVRALGIIYGDKFDQGEQALAGNVRENHITMRPEEWEIFLKN